MRGMITYTIDDVFCYFFFFGPLFYSTRTRLSSMPENGNSVFRTSRNVINISRDARISRALRGFIIPLAEVTRPIFIPSWDYHFIHVKMCDLSGKFATFLLVGECDFAREIGSNRKNIHEQNRSVFFFAIHIHRD